MSLGDQLQKARKEAGMSLEEVSSIVGVTKQTVYKYEHNLIKPSPEVMIKLKTIYDKDLNYFFGKSKLERLHGYSYKY